MANSPESPERVPLEDAYGYASRTHQLVLGTSLTGVDGLAAGDVETAPTTIYDLGGDVLFYDFPVSGEAGVIGTIRTAATSRLGAPVVSVSGSAPRWSPDRARRLATERLHADTPDAQVTSSRLVCYAYPKIGIELTYAGGSGDSATELFDASSGEPVGTADDEENQFTRYSLLDHFADDRAGRVASFERLDRALRSMHAPGERATEAASLRLFPFPVITADSGTVLQSPFCPGSPPGNSHYGQITDYFCVDASAQMLMEHYGWNYTQNQIATAMGTSSAIGGTNGNGLTTGFASLTHNQFDLTFDSGASRDQQFADAVSEISANRPLFTQVPHHYRVCMGYSEISVFGVAFDQWLYIYDPWPWNPDLCQGGAVYWESWSTSPVMWFGIARHA